MACTRAALLGKSTRFSNSDVSDILVKTSGAILSPHVASHSENTAALSHRVHKVQLTVRERHVNSFLTHSSAWKRNR